MGVQLAKESVDVGVVVRDAAKCLAFYRDTLGFVHEGTMPLPGGGSMERLLCGTSLIKLVSLATLPATSNPPGGPGGASGLRYWTISVTNLDELLATCEALGYRVVLRRRTVRPGVSAGIVEDPEGNWVEFLETS